MTDINRHNQLSWDQQSAAGQSPWVQPVTTDAVNAARAGDWQIILTPTKSVPKSWFGNLKDKDLLCLASGGGQQAPILAAAGATVTSFDQSPEQLRKDADVRHGTICLFVAYKEIWQICLYSMTQASM